jgi:hypothetical protein
MARQVDLRSMLSVGRHALDPGRACEVAELVAAHPAMASELVACLWDDDPGVASRAADALERLTCERPKILSRWKDSLLGLLAEAKPKKVRWNLALIAPRLKLTPAECRRAAGVLNTWLDDPSSIVKTLALQGLADLTRQDASLLTSVVDLLRLYGRSGTPAMRARSRILLKSLERRR